MNDEYKRLLTFPFEWKGNPTLKFQLAKNGFFYHVDSSHKVRLGRSNGSEHVRSENVVKYTCYLCKCFIESDRGEASVVFMHKRISPTCSMALTGGHVTNVPMEFKVDMYELERHRLLSFHKGDWSYPVDPRDLAASGMYWTGTADVVRCHFCMVEIKNWQVGDVPHEHHVSQNPKCVYFSGGAQNFPIGRDDGPVSMLHRHVRLIDKLIVESGTTRLSPDRPDVEKICLLSPPKYPEFASESVRKASYVNWPIGLTQKPVQLAEAGFFYSTVGDRVTCFSCGGGLKDWLPHFDPLTEHAKWFKECQYLKMVKDQEWIEKVQKQLNFDPTIRTPTTSPYNGNKSIVLLILPCAHLNAYSPETWRSTCSTCKRRVEAYIKVQNN